MVQLHDVVESLRPAIPDIDIHKVALIARSLCVRRHPWFDAEMLDVIDDLSVHVKAGDLTVSDRQADVIRCGAVTQYSDLRKVIDERFPNFLTCTHLPAEWLEWQNFVTSTLNRPSVGLWQIRSRGPYPQYASSDFGGKHSEPLTEVIPAQEARTDPAEMVAAASLALRSARAALDTALATGWHGPLLGLAVAQLGVLCESLDDACRSGWPVAPY